MINMIILKIKKVEQNKIIKVYKSLKNKTDKYNLFVDLIESYGISIIYGMSVLKFIIKKEEEEEFEKIIPTKIYQYTNKN